MKTIVMSLGGSLIVPAKINSIYLRKFAKLISSFKKKGFKFVIVTGGGNIARIYIDALRDIGMKDVDLSYAGILATRANAFTVGKFLGTRAKVPDKMAEIKNLLKNNSVVVCGGFKPGMTSDGDAADIARLLNLNLLINLTNVDGLFDKDPKNFKDAKLISEISSEDFLMIMKKIGHKVGQHFVLDLEAAKVCNKNKIKVCILNGNNLREVECCISGKPFKGTSIY